ncbi:hypothetical protein SNEBB_006456, partial [Seison nebaliae]
MNPSKKTSANPWTIEELKKVKEFKESHNGKTLDQMAAELSIQLGRTVPTTRARLGQINRHLGNMEKKLAIPKPSIPEAFRMKVSTPPSNNANESSTELSIDNSLPVSVNNDDNTLPEANGLNECTFIIPKFTESSENFVFHSYSTTPKNGESTNNIVSQICSTPDVGLLFSQSPTAENVDTPFKMNNPLKRQRVFTSSPIKEFRTCSTQTNIIETISTATSPIKLQEQPNNDQIIQDDIDMSSESIIPLNVTQDQIIITETQADQSLKMAREYFGGKPYTGQQKLVAEKYPSPDEMKILVAQDCKKAANFIFNHEKNESYQAPNNEELVRFFSEAWNKPKPTNGNKYKIEQNYGPKNGNNLSITSQLKVQEVVDAITRMNTSGAPGPDGAPINNIKLDESMEITSNKGNSFKYLGVTILPNGAIQQATVKDLKEMIKKVDSVKIDGRAKFRIMERYGLPQLLFIMEQSDQTRAELRKLNGCYRNFVRKIHSLRHDFPNDGIHLKPQNGGIGATDIEERIARGKYNSTTKMINDTTSKSFVKIVNKSKIKKVRTDNAKYLTIGDDDTDLKGKHQEKLINHLSKSARVNTSAKPFYKNKRANRWITNQRIPNKLKNDFFKLRYNIMPTRSSTRFFNGGKIRCRGCGGPTENVKHLISKCPANHGLITLRHNSIIKELIRIGSRNPETTRIFQEKTFETTDGRIKPDLILVSNRTAKVFEVAVPFEENDSTLETNYQNKLKKYKKHHDIIAESLQADRVIFEPIIFGALGDVHEKSASAIVRNFRTNKYSIADLSQLMLRKSRNM